MKSGRRATRREKLIMKRYADYPILDLILNRWSPRAMSGEKISHKELMSLFEAARWAPSAYNHQPWRFIYAHRETQEWNELFSLLVDSNQIWAVHAAVLIVVLSHQKFEYNNKYSRTHSFDTGAAAEHIALQGHSMGLVVHCMEGFDYDRVRIELAIPEDYTVEVMFAIGRPGSLALLPEALQKRETPSDRLKVQELIYRGKFGQR